MNKKRKEENTIGYIGDKDGQETGRFYIYKNVHGNDGDIELFRKPYFCADYVGADCVGCILIKYRDFIVPGLTIEELHESEYRKALSLLEEQGYVTKNGFGTMFWKD